jgi:hypothetical protein
MVAHADTDSLENVVLFVHKDYICVSQNFHVSGTNGHHFTFHVTPRLFFSLKSVIITVKVLLSENVTSY